MLVDIEVSIGELIDKITILQIKQQRIQDSLKLEHVNYELDLLKQHKNRIFNGLNPINQNKLTQLELELYNTNCIIWDIEDKIRWLEQQQLFNDEFVSTARGVYHNNDHRSELKRLINSLCNSSIVEIKSYH